MLSFSQRDPAWANKKIGFTDLTIGRYGCTITGIADLSTYFGDNLNPATVADRLKFSGALVLWASAKFHTFEFWFRQYGRNDKDISNALADPDTAVLLEVANGSHWVVATGRPTWWNPHYKIADPWFGDRADMRRYGDNITGAAYFRRTY